jgi:carbamoyltransferase
MHQPRTILGLGGFDHNGSITLVRNGELVAFLEAERVTRRKNVGFTSPDVLDETLAAMHVGSVDHVALADAKYVEARAEWLEPWLARRFPHATRSIHLHHQCHIAAAFWTSDFDEALAVSIDGRGDGLSVMAALMDRSGRIEQLLTVPSANSMGRLWWATSAACGLGDHYAAGKTMAWAAFGTPRLYDAIAAAITLLPDGGFRFPPPPAEPLRYRESPLFMAWLDELAGGSEPGAGVRHADLAASVQRVTEDVVEHLVRSLVRQSGVRKVCLGGGVALNGLANQRLLTAGVVDALHVPFVPDDRGLSLGAAALSLAELGGTGWSGRPSPFLGPLPPTPAVPAGFAAVAGDAVEAAADLLARGGILGRFGGRDEAGPRALGNRSILASPTVADTARRLNMTVKRREPFRPFGCSILAERASAWLEMEGASPYMLRIVPVRPEKRADVAAIVHVDGTTRPQTVTDASNPVLFALLTAMERRGHPPILLNTSFNGRGEPIAHRWSEAIEMATRMELDALLTDPQLFVRTTFPRSEAS